MSLIRHSNTCKVTIDSAQEQDKGSWEFVVSSAPNRSTLDNEKSHKAKIDVDVLLPGTILLHCQLLFEAINRIPQLY